MSGASKGRKYRAAHEASIRRTNAFEQIEREKVNQYWNFASGSPSFAGWNSNHLMKPGQMHASHGNQDSFRWMTPDSYKRRITVVGYSGTTNTFKKSAATYKNIANQLRPGAIRSELGDLAGGYAKERTQLTQRGARKPGSKRGKSGGTTSQMMKTMSDGKKRLIASPTASAAQQVMLGNASMSEKNKIIMGISDYNNANSSSNTVSYQQFTEKQFNTQDLAAEYKVGSATYKNPDSKSGSTHPDYAASYKYTTYAGGVNIESYSRKSEDFDALQSVREKYSDSVNPADQVHLAVQEKIYKDGQRNKYLQNFAFGGGTLSMESRAGKDERVGSTKSNLRASEKGNVQSEADKRSFIQYQLKFEDPSSPDYNPRKGKSLSVDQVDAFRQDQMNLDLTDSGLHNKINTRTTDTQSTISKLSGYMKKYEKLKSNKNSSQEHRNKVYALNAEIKLEFPKLNASGNSAQMLDKISTRIDTENVSLTTLNKQRDAVSLYTAKTRILERDIARGELKTITTRADNKKRKADKRESERAAAQKEFDDLWRAGAGQALMTDTSVSNIGASKILAANQPVKESKLTRNVNIVKKYDAWGSRQSYIGGQLDTRRSDLNRYYNSNWEQDFTVSDTEASQYMFGSDTPSGTSLTRNAVTAIGINQRKPRKAIDSINRILAQTGENRSVYAENLAGIETKLLTLKEKQALKKAENDAIKARIAQQVTDDFNAGDVEINTTFRDNITGTSEELYDLNTQVAEHNTVKSYYKKSLTKTDADTATLKDTLEQVKEVKKINDFNTITELVEDGGNINASKPSAVGYNNSQRFRRRTGGKQRMVRSGAGSRTRSGRNLSGLVI